MRVIYFGDVAGDLEEERDYLKDYLKRTMNLEVEIEIFDTPPFDERFDIMFFDWGGMSLGNSLLEHFCHEFIKCAKDNPGRVFIMTSSFTKAAMEDALAELPEKPDNIYLTLEAADTTLRCFVE